MQDSIAINLAQEIASAKAGKTHINIEDFVKNVLDTFTFSVKASSFKKHLEQIDEVDGQGFYIQRPDEDVFIPSKPQTEFDKRLKILKDYLKVDLDAVSPEVLEAFQKLNPEALKLFPDSLISAVLKKCSDYNPIFLNSDMPMEEKLQAFQKGKDNSAKKEEYNAFDDNNEDASVIPEEIEKNNADFASLVSAETICETAGKFIKEKQMYFTGVQVNMNNILIKNAVFQ